MSRHDDEISLYNLNFGESKEKLPARPGLMSYWVTIISNEEWRAGAGPSEQGATPLPSPPTPNLHTRSSWTDFNLRGVKGVKKCITNKSVELTLFLPGGGGISPLIVYHVTKSVRNRVNALIFSQYWVNFKKPPKTMKNDWFFVELLRFLILAEY